MFVMFTYLLTDFLTYSMEQSPPLEAKRFSASPEISPILWNPTVHYRIHKCPLTVPVLSHIKPVQVPQSHFLKVLFNITLPSTSESFKWAFSLRFPHQKPVRISSLLHTCYMPRLFHSS